MNVAATASAGFRARRLAHRAGDVAGFLFVALVPVVALIPTLLHGTSLGNYDLQTVYGGLAQRGAPVHYTQATDQLRLFMPLTDLVWRQVHGGHLPLWNPYNALGIPLAFNWESAPLSVPVLLGYLVPMHLAYTVQVVTTYVIAGTGVYMLGRVLGLGTLGSAVAGTVFELSGPLFSLVGWSFGGVMAWAGWLLCAVLLLIRSRHRLRNVVLVAVVLACAIYAGEPEGVSFLAICVVVVATVMLLARLPRFGGTGPVLRPVTDLVVAGVVGVALSGPLLLPGLQVGGLSLRNTQGGQLSVAGQSSLAQALPLHDLAHLVFQGFDGLPVSGTPWFPDRPLYIDTVAYVGVIALVLAGGALWWRRRSPQVLAFGVMAVVMAAIAFAAPVVFLLDHLPFHLGGVLWYRALVPLALALAVLAGVGADVVVRRATASSVSRVLGIGFGLAAFVLALVWAVGRGHLAAAEASTRARSFIWPVVETGIGLAVAGVLALTARSSRTLRLGSGRAHRCAGTVAVGVLLVCEAAFLITAGQPVWASNAGGFVATPAVVALQRAVGTAVVGFGPGGCDGIGITPNVNAVFGVQELAAYDPTIPAAYFTSWRAQTGQPAGTLGLARFVYCPGVTSAAQARRYGVGYVLERHGERGPGGAVFDRVVGDEDLYRVPGAAAATLSPLVGGHLPPADDAGRPVPVTHPGPASWRVRTRSSVPTVLRLRLTDVPGWQATVDGHPLRLQRFSGVMLQARVPAGVHTVELRYWPRALTEGIVLAGGALLGLAVAGVVARRRGRQVPRDTDADSPVEDDRDRHQPATVRS